MVIAARALFFLLVVVATSLCGGCLTVSALQFGFEDAKPYGWVDDKVRPADWIEVGDEIDDGTRQVAVTTAIVKVPGPPKVGGSGLRYLTVQLDASGAPPPALAVPEVAGMTSDDLAAWIAGLGDADRVHLIDRARAAKAGLTAARRAPDWLGPPPPHVASRSEQQEDGSWQAVPLDADDLPPPGPVDVVLIGDFQSKVKAYLVAYRLPRPALAGWPNGGLAALATMPPPMPPPDIEPDAAPYAGAFLLPGGIRTSTTDRLLRGTTGVVLVPAAATMEVGFSLLPLAMVVGLVALAA